MSQVNVYIHFVWSTKSRTPFLATKELRKMLWKHIRENARSKGIFVDFIDGYSDHCHCLVSLGADQTIQKIMQLLKGESAYWLNKQGILTGKFEWQDEYFAVSVSESLVDRVREYIRHQEEHHQHISFQKEFEVLVEKCGLKKYSDTR